MIEVLSRWKKANSFLTQQFGREPSVEEIGLHLQFSPSKIEIVLRALSASAPVGRGGDEDNPFDLEDVLATETKECESGGILNEYDLETLKKSLEYALTDRERHIVALHYGLGTEPADKDCESLSLEKIGEKIGLTRERVRQIESRALHKLQMYLQQKNAREERERLERKRHRDEDSLRSRPKPRMRTKTDTLRKRGKSRILPAVDSNPAPTIPVPEKPIKRRTEVSIPKKI
jgi:RNA polymerase primary sigma factor